MSRLALRYYLPIVQVFLLLGIFVGEQLDRYEASRQPPQAVGVGWDIRSDGGRPSLFADVFEGLNTPVFFAMLPLATILPPEYEWLHAVAILPMILAFWYSIGRIVDRFRGLLPSKTLFERSADWRRFGQIALSISTIAFAVGVLLLFSADEVASLYAYPLMIWGGVAGFWLISEMRRPSNPLALNLN
jgi:hypothetical protein